MIRAGKELAGGMCVDFPGRVFLRVSVHANERHQSLYLLVVTDGEGGLHSSYCNDEWDIVFGEEKQADEPSRPRAWDVVREARVA